MDKHQHSHSNVDLQCTRQCIHLLITNTNATAPQINQGRLQQSDT